MRIEDLRNALKTEPFHPFRLHLTDGRTIDIRHPEFMFIPPRNARLVVITDESGILEWIDPLLVVSLKELDGATENGDQT